MKLKLIQDQEIKLAVRETRKPDSVEPLDPMSTCDLCGDESGLVTPEGMAFCGPCWRAHRAVEEGQRKFAQMEARALDEPDRET